MRLEIVVIRIFLVNKGSGVSQERNEDTKEYY